MEIAAEPSALAPPPPAPPRWAALKDEELLAVRICDLGVRIEGSELEPRLRQFHDDLAPAASPSAPIAISATNGSPPTAPPPSPSRSIWRIPASKRSNCARCSKSKEAPPNGARCCCATSAATPSITPTSSPRARTGRAIFGSPETEYTPETYTPRPYSRSFVRHLPNWYAQAHPDEDFAETFAVWLSSSARRLAPALPRLEGSRKTRVRRDADAGGRRHQAASSSAAAASPTRASSAPRWPATTPSRRKLYAEDFPDFYDADLRSIFGNGEPGGEPPKETAASFMRQHRAALIASIVQWTGQRKYTVSMLVQKLIQRCQELKLKAPADPARLLLRPGVLPRGPGHQSPVHRPLQEVRLA